MKWIHAEKLVQYCNTLTLMSIILVHASNNLHLDDETIDMHGWKWKKTTMDDISFFIGALNNGFHTKCIMIFLQLSLDYMYAKMYGFFIYINFVFSSLSSVSCLHDNVIFYKIQCSIPELKWQILLHIY